MFRNSNRRVTFRPQHGQQVLVRANITLYEPRGDYQIIVESMQPAGEGLLQQKYEQLKASSRKRAFRPAVQKAAALPCPLRWGHHLENRCGTARYFARAEASRPFPARHYLPDRRAG
jgi:exodeoxyribonuclease VII large subunit